VPISSSVEVSSTLKTQLTETSDLPADAARAKPEPAKTEAGRAVDAVRENASDDKAKPADKKRWQVR
jgi:hypothetical protein